MGNISNAIENISHLKAFDDVFKERFENMDLTPILMYMIDSAPESALYYLAEQFKQIGLEPAMGDSYFQEVNLVKLTADAPMKLNISGGKQELKLEFSEEFIGGTPQISDKIEILNSDIIFVGYGINAPENNWNDYALSNDRVNGNIVRSRRR